MFKLRKPIGKINKSRFAGILLLGFTILLIELIFRSLFYFKLIGFPEVEADKVIHQYSADEKLIYELKPLFAVKDSHYIDIKTNSFGMRDYEYTQEKPLDTFRICVIGDSVSFGIHMPLDDTFAKVLERKLNAHSKKKIEILNFSVAGYNASQEQIAFENRVMAFNPDLVLVGFCPNDDTYTDGLGELSVSLLPNALGKRLHSQALTFISYHIDKAILSKTENMGKVECFFKKLSAERQRKNFEVLIAIFPYNYTNLDKYSEKTKHRRVREIAQKNGLKFLDVLDSWQNMDSTQRTLMYLQDDIVHFSAEGMRQIGEILFSYIQEQSIIKGLT